MNTLMSYLKLRVVVFMSLLLKWSIGRIVSATVVMFWLDLSSAHAAIYEKELEVFLRQSTAQPIRVMALFHYQSAIQLPIVESSQKILEFLLRQNGEAYSRWTQDLIQKGVRPQDVRVTSTSWLNHSVSLLVTPEGLRQVLKSPFIKKVYGVRPENFESRAAQTAIRQLSAPQRAMTETHLLEARSQFPNLFGQGQLIGLIDTGVNVTSPVLVQKVVRFFDASQKQIKSPFDFGDHGTGIASLLVAGNTQNPIGVAPASQLIVSAGFDTEHLIRGLEFMANPDGNLSTTQDIPRVVNNSWNSDGQSDQEIYYRALASLEALGVVMVFSAGNSGPKPFTISHPKEFPTTLVVGATQPGGVIWPGSSVGPANFKQQSINKPDLVAPGVDIISLLPNGQWISQTGTSFAAPWVTGTIALMNQMRPGLSAPQLRQVVMNNTDRAQAGWHPQYGNGRLNIVRTLNALKLSGPTVRFEGPRGRDFAVPVQNAPILGLRQLLQWADTPAEGWRNF